MEVAQSQKGCPLQVWFCASGCLEHASIGHIQGFWVPEMPQHSNCHHSPFSLGFFGISSSGAGTRTRSLDAFELFSHGQAKGLMTHVSQQSSPFSGVLSTGIWLLHAHMPLCETPWWGDSAASHQPAKPGLAGDANALAQPPAAPQPKAKPDAPHPHPASGQRQDGDSLFTLGEAARCGGASADCSRQRTVLFHLGGERHRRAPETTWVPLGRQALLVLR